MPHLGRQKTRHVLRYFTSYLIQVNRPAMDGLESMAVFVEIVSNGNLTTAAERLGLSSSVVGKHLNTLEIRLGVKLLSR